MPGDLVGEHPDVIDDRPQFPCQAVDVAGCLGEIVVDLRVADQFAERALRFIERLGEHRCLLEGLVEAADRDVDLRHHPLAPLTEWLGEPLEVAEVAVGGVDGFADALHGGPQVVDHVGE